MTDRRTDGRTDGQTDGQTEGIAISPTSVRLSVTLSPPKPLDKIQPNLVCELLT